MKISQKAGIISLIICSTLWSTGGLFIKLLPWHPMVIAGLRGAIASAIICAAAVKICGSHPIISRQTLYTGFFFGAACSLFVVANKMTTAANAIMLQSTNPVFIILFSLIFLHKKTSKKDILTAVLVLCGITLFFLDNLSIGKLAGNLIALLAGISLAVAFMLACSAKSLLETISGVMLGHFLCALAGIPFLFTSPPEFNLTTAGAILFLGVFQLGIPYVLMSLGASACSPLTVSLLGMLEPVMNPIWVALFLHELPGTKAICGSVIVILTLCWWCITNAQTPENSAEA